MPSGLAVPLGHECGGHDQGGDSCSSAPLLSWPQDAVTFFKLLGSKAWQHTVVEQEDGPSSGRRKQCLHVLII